MDQLTGGPLQIRGLETCRIIEDPWILKRNPHAIQECRRWKNVLPAGAELSVELPDEPLLAFAGPLQMEQVLGNLVVNAWQAILEPRTGSRTFLESRTGSRILNQGGKLSIRAQRI